ncbi:hypothetical protein B0H13DRAFT_1915498 [Mycena leptocephala]|nr:hypothetical protein B0H13DRAFT_1915498 [Mycena leptocephala]
MGAPIPLKTCATIWGGKLPCLSISSWNMGPCAYVPPFHPPQGLYTMPGYPTFQPAYTPYNSRAEYTLAASIDFRAPASTLHPDSVDISSASVALPSTVPVPDNSAFNRSAANPYSYPMTHVPPVANSSTASTLQSNTSTSI